jgi:antirestriction protein
MNTTRTTTESPRIFLTDYASYNNGTQFEFGHWVDLTDFLDADSLAEYITDHFEEADAKSPLDSPREEIMITDFENFPKCFYSESYDTATMEKLFEFINLDEDDKKLLEMYADATGYRIEEIELSDAQNAFQGTADTEADFAERTAEECGEIPKDLPSWIVIDWEASWNCNLRHDYSTATDENGTIYFFLNH